MADLHRKSPQCGFHWSDCCKVIDCLRAINCVIFTIEVFSRYGEEVVQSQGPCQLEDVVDDQQAVQSAVDPLRMIPVHILHIRY